VVAILLMAISAFLGFDVRVAVPDLNYRSLEEAFNLLAESHLTPKALPSELPGAELGRVLPNSESLPGGQLVPWRSIVLFKIADNGANRLEHPRTNNAIECKIVAGGSCTVAVDGTSSKLVNDRRLDLILWARSSHSNWFPQRALDIQDGTWKGTAQVGNSRYHASEGELVEFALTVRPRSTAATRPPSDGFAELPEESVDRAERVTLRIVQD